MKKIIPFLFLISLLASFTLKSNSANDLEYELNSLIRTFSNNVSEVDCERYFRKINQLKDDISQAKRDDSNDQAALRRLEKKTNNFYDFAATLTRCPNTSNELEISSFNSLLDETGLSPTLVKRNGCAAIYKVNINGFQTYYAVNSSSESKSLKIAMPGTTFTMNIMCNSVEGFSQGEILRSINTASITCSLANLMCRN
ncbi:hypothetical protein [Pontibacter virosus]|uniref:hypothetical protein n=1 Tax=Pontibacter virosus TaxID=1765052 RepID=UPI00105836E6|nr:hypothetical protein [Pontibacter virosus]